MNYLEKLLDGVEVEWKLLEQLVVDKFWIMPATPKFNEGETIPYITSKNIKGGHISFDKTKFISREDYIELSRNRPILAGDFLISMIGTIGEVAVVKESDLAFYGQNMYLIRLDETVIMSRYFWHFFDSPRMKSHFQAVKNNSGQGYLKANNIDKLEIPIPCPDNPEKSLAIQAEIVRVLDAFTAMTAELTAELNMRKKQYNYYRDQLLSFEEGEVEHLPMGDETIGVFVRGGSLQKKDFTDTGVGCIHYGQIYTYYGTYADKTKTFVSDTLAKKCRKAQSGNLVIATTSENDEDVCKAVAWLGDEDIAVSSDACIYKHNLNPKYVAYFFQTEQFQSQKRQYITGAKVRRVNADNLAKILIPVPSPEEQERIVSILDKFDALTNSITEGLPREIELRQKQYEYYRDLLLSFPKPHSDEAA
uniref:restriction endonuclease subunit S n=1 Tax=Vibrio cholerae TaxID=666 RepID=UPI003F674092